MSAREIGELPYIECDVAVKRKGLVLTRSGASAVGKARLVDADKEVPIGVTYRSTEDPLNLKTYLTGQKVAYFREGEVECVLANDNAEINPGDPLMAVRDSAATPNDGVVDKLTIRTDTIANYEADLAAIVGFATEYKAALAGATYGTKIKARLWIRGA